MTGVPNELKNVWFIPIYAKYDEFISAFLIRWSEEAFVPSCGAEPRGLPGACTTTATRTVRTLNPKQQRVSGVFPVENTLSVNAEAGWP